MNLPGRGLAKGNPLAKLFAPRGTKFPGENAGWAATRTSATGRRGGLPRRLADYMGTYGGTEDSITWVYACVKLIASEAASYPYEIIEEDGDVVEEGEVDNDLQALLDFPNPMVTYFDFVAYTMMDLELAGNSYWVKDERNGLGQPNALYRMRPDLVQVATDKQGKIAGYVYSIEGQQIPFDLDEVLRFMYPNPLDDRYGMGTVEAIQRALGAELAETEHINGFFSDGARISGILTTADNLSDLQFERLRSEFEAQFKSGGSNNFGVLIAEQGTGYTPLSSVPAGSGVTELRRMGKDEILSGFGVPEFLLGGIGQGGIYKMSEAQHIFTRNMKPRSRRFSERMTMDLVSLWEGMEFRQDVTVAEPSEVKLANAAKLMGMGASLNQVLDQAGLPPIDDEQADEPLIQQGILPFSIAVKQAQAQLPPEPGADPFAGGGPGGFGGGGFGGDPFGGSFDEQLEGFVSGRRSMRAVRPKTPKRNRVREVGTKSGVQPPELPAGFEQLGSVKAAHADQQTMQHILQHHARVLKSGYPDALTAIRDFFVDQRKRVISRLPASEKRPGTNHMRYPLKNISMDRLWDDEVENNALLDVYMQIVDEVGGKAVEAGRIINSALTWDLQNPLIDEAREDLGKMIVRINEETRERIADVVETGMRAGYSVPQIAQGFEKEKYPGIVGVFDQAGAARAETIARTETARIYNAAANASYEAAGVEHVEVIDGDGDAACKAANGQRWTLDKAKENPTEHPNCVRSFVPIIDVRKSVREAAAQLPAARSHISDGPNAGAREAFMRSAKDAVDSWDNEFGIATSGPTVKRLGDWIETFLNASEGNTEFADAMVKLADYHERLEYRRLSPRDFFDYSAHVEEAKSLIDPHAVSRLIDEAFVAGEDVVGTKASIQRLLPDGRPDPDFEERLHPRGPGGRFRTTPDAPKPVGSKPKPADIDATGSSKPRPKLGTREDLEMLGVPSDVIAQIQELGLDENLKKRKKGETAKRLLGPAEDTKQLHTDKRSGAYSAKRKELHDKIVDLMLREKKPVFNAEKGFVEWEHDENGEYVGTPEVMRDRFVAKIADYDRKLSTPEPDADAPRWRAERDAYRSALNNIGTRKKALFLAGGNASGKSTALYAAENQDVMKPGPDNVEINFDLIKERIPEFQQMAAAHDIYGTDATHFESADIARRLLEEARQRGVSTIVDASGDSRTTGFQDTIRDSKRMGYDTEVLMVDAPVEIALRDSIKRALKTGRYIPAPILRNIHANSVARFDEWKEDAAIDKWTLYRRTDDGVMKAAEGGQGSMKVLAEGAYRGVLDKARDAGPLKVPKTTQKERKPGRIAEGTPVANPDSPEAINVGDDVVKAAELIAAGVPVELDSPRVVSTLVDKLAEMVEDAIARGEKAPIYDLCRVTVKGTNLFCVESKGIPRIQMPQLKGAPVAGSRAAGMTPDRRGEVDITPQFKTYLAGKGIGITSGQESAAYMKATQNELDGVKVAGIAKFLEGGGQIEGENMLLSKDGYIVDGHHRWAAVVANDARDNELGNDPPMDVDFIDLDIIRLLREANRFAADWGLPQQSVAAPMNPKNSAS